MLDQSDKGGRMALPRLVIGGLALLIIVVLLAQNSQETTITLFFWEITLRLWLALGLMALLGAGLGQAVGSWRKRR